MYGRAIRLRLDCDASLYGLRTGLFQIHLEKTEKPIAYTSRTLNKNGLYYTEIDKEGASIIFGLNNFCQYSLGTQFILTTDTEPTEKYVIQYRIKLYCS